MTSPWTVTYWRRGTEGAIDCENLREAVAYASDGLDTLSYSVTRITAPDGRIFEGRELLDAILCYQLGDAEFDARRAAKWGPLLEGDAR